MIFLFSFILCGFSSNEPFNDSFLGIFVALITPFGLISQAIMHKNYGYDVFHRVFGEYKMNQLISFWSPTLAFQAIGKAIIDGVLIIIVFVGTGYLAKNDGFMLMPDSNGMLVS